MIPKSVCDNVLMDFDSLREAGSSLGTAAVIVMDKSTDLIRAIARISAFYKHESCGQCTPCREGTHQMLAAMASSGWPAARIADLSQLMRDASICGLGQAAPNPTDSVLRHFPHEVHAAKE